MNFLQKLLAALFGRKPTPAPPPPPAPPPAPVPAPVPPPPPAAYVPPPLPDVEVLGIFCGIWPAVTPKHQEARYGAGNPLRQDSRYGLEWDRFPGRRPTIFPEDNQAAIDRILMLGDQAGLAAYLTCWFNDVAYNYGADLMASSKSPARCKWALLWASTPESLAPDYSPTRTWFLDAVRKLAPRLKGDRYYRRDGKPVLVIFDERLISNVATTAQEKTRLIADLRAITGPLYLVVMGGNIEHYAQVQGVDALTTYNVRDYQPTSGVKRLAHSFAELDKSARDLADIGAAGVKHYAPHMQWWPNAMCGWDRRPWGGTEENDPLHDQCTPMPSEFEAHMRAMAASARAKPGKTLVVYAGNEFGEGGSFLPTVDTGTGRVEAMGRAFRA